MTATPWSLLLLLTSAADGAVPPAQPGRAVHRFEGQEALLVTEGDDTGKLTAEAVKLVQAVAGAVPRGALLTVIACVPSEDVFAPVELAQTTGLSAVEALLAAGHQRRYLSWARRVVPAQQCPAGFLLETLPLPVAVQEAARVLSVHGTVTRKDVDASEAALKEGDMLSPGQTVQTRSGSMVSLRVDNRAVIWLEPASRLRLGDAGVAAEQRRPSLHLEEGGVVLDVPHADYRPLVQSGSATVTVLPGHARIVCVPEGLRLEVHQGGIAVPAVPPPAGASGGSRASPPVDAASVAVAAGQGAVLSGAGAVAPRPLPPVVTDLRPLSGILKPRSQLTWMPVDTAAKYRLQVARDPQLVWLVHDATVPGPAAPVPDLPAGVYYWRVLTVELHGYQSPPSAIFSFRVPALPR